MTTLGSVVLHLAYPGATGLLLTSAVKWSRSTKRVIFRLDAWRGKGPGLFSSSVVDRGEDGPSCGHADTPPGAITPKRYGEGER